MLESNISVYELLHIATTEDVCPELWRDVGTLQSGLRGITATELAADHLQMFGE